MPEHLFLSPHLDDAVLSCGGQIAQLVRRGQKVLVVTVMAGDVPSAVADSDFVRELHARWGLGENPPAARRAEDLAALGVLGGGAIHLPFPDCVYRVGQMGGPLYPTRDAIFGTVAPVEAEEMVERIAEALREVQAGLPRGTRMYLPLTAGHHVDHQIVRTAGERLATSRRPILYYEDYPYAEQPDELAAARSPGARATRVELDEEALAAKISAIACYRSQLSSFFRDESEMAARVRAYAKMTGNGRPAERLWSE